MMDPWTVTSSIAAAISAMFAAIAAGASLWQVVELRAQKREVDRREAVVRAFEYSAAASPHFFEYRQKLVQAVGTREAGNSITVEQSAIIANDPELVNAFNFVLNHYGRMATAYRYGIIDKEAAKNLHRFGFLRFWNTYKAFIDAEFESKPAVAAQYADSRALYEEWKE